MNHLPVAIASTATAVLLIASLAGCAPASSGAVVGGTAAPSAPAKAPATAAPVGSSDGACKYLSIADLNSILGRSYVTSKNVPLSDPVDYAYCSFKTAGKAEFDELRVRFAAFQADVSSTRIQALASLDDASDELHVALLAIAIGLVLVVAGLALVLRNTAIRPVHRLAAEARRVADGDFGHEVARTGPREIRGLAADMNTMRLRILRELATVQEANEALAEHATELQRSNAELEQFAYVASHDLQEPLRKVTSFCQLLQRRYGGQLDERADQYIDFAVDGAKRMQVLINDLLAFSRAGRSAEELGPVACDEALAAATANLSTQIADAGAVIEAGPLPVVRGQLTLMAVVFQNLLGNALKFTGERPPRIVVTAERDGAFWSFSVTDNGIGIEPQYADRVFLIFQRLHERAAYPGTGIGLAMCRKIVEYFGGRIWLDTGVADGATFRFTVPALTGDEESEGTDGTDGTDG